ncbi:MAG TPA: hypothetical protein VK809_06405, partial [Bacteroidia bacterium]|nr:hypothetical protein [Bacteroidia bacterium]
MRKFHPLRIWILTVFLFPIAKLSAQNVAINTTGNSAYVSAILDLSNQNTAGTVGLLPPYVDLNLPLTIFQLSGTAAQSNGIIIYATGAGTAPAGLYYWDNAGSTWVAMGGGSTGSGTLNYLARWTPNGSTLGIGVTQDNGSVAVIQQTAAAFGTTTELTVNANATETNAILGATTIANGTGVKGSNTQITGTSTGVAGSVGTYNAPVWGAVGVYGSANNNITYGVEGNNPSGDPTGGAGIIGYDYSGTGVIGSNDLITQVGFYHGPHGTGGNFFSAYNGLTASYNMTGAGGNGALAMGYNSGGPINPNASYNYDFGLVGDFGGTAGGAGFGAAVGGFIGNTAVPSYRAGVMGGSNSADYGALGYNT